ncbi:TglA family RiPP precursor [Thalassococcus sp. S3]|uniref:aminotransferase class III-fold pyridoxal phosphate-dependent enzyme n=1 Tax=Thalassococcus sp. S3 TaxID=2017482 RepID=UPI0026AD7D75
MREQLATLNFYSGAAGSEPGEKFAKRLLEKMPGLSRLYFTTSGSEANEKVYKMVRQISQQKRDGKKSNSVPGSCREQGVLIGASNRSMAGFNNTLLLSPALVCTRENVDSIVNAIDTALTHIFAPQPDEDDAFEDFDLDDIEVVESRVFA